MLKMRLHQNQGAVQQFQQWVAVWFIKNLITWQDIWMARCFQENFYICHEKCKNMLKKREIGLRQERVIFVHHLKINHFL